jgi:hypothetical protein
LFSAEPFSYCRLPIAECRLEEKLGYHCGEVTNPQTGFANRQLAIGNRK